MKFIINLIKFIGILAFIPLCIFLIELWKPISLNKIFFIRTGVFSLIITLILVIFICKKKIKKEQFKEVNIFRTVFFAFVLAVILHPLLFLINYYGYVLNEISQEGISFMSENFVLGVLIIAPILEELSIRIGIINTFKGKLPNWLLIIGTSLLFGILHIKNINFVIAAFVMGVILSYLFIHSGNALLLILAHFFINLFTYIPSQYYAPFYLYLLEHIYIPIIVFALVFIVIAFKRDKFKRLLLSTVGENI